MGPLNLGFLFSLFAIPTLLSIIVSWDDWFNADKSRKDLVFDYRTEIRS